MELYDQISEAAFYKALERMCKSGELVKIAKGTYHLPKVSKYGIVPPSEKEIISALEPEVNVKDYDEKEEQIESDYTRYIDDSLWELVKQNEKNNILNRSLSSEEKINLRYSLIEFAKRCRKYVFLIGGLQELRSFGVLRDNKNLLGFYR